MNYVDVFIDGYYHRVRDYGDSTKHVDEEGEVTKPSPCIRMQNGNKVRDNLEGDTKAVEKDHNNGDTYINSPGDGFFSL